MNGLANFFTRIVNRYMPDPLVVAIVLTALTVLFAMFSEGTSFLDATRYWGDGFWNLLAFTMQMTVILLAGFILAAQSAQGMEGLGHIIMALVFAAPAMLGAVLGEGMPKAPWERCLIGPCCRLAVPREELRAAGAEALGEGGGGACGWRRCGGPAQDVRRR